MTPTAALAALAQAAGDNTDPMPPRLVRMGREWVEYIAPVIFDTPEELKRLADAAGVKVQAISVDLSKLTVTRWEYDPKGQEGNGTGKEGSPEHGTGGDEKDGVPAGASRS